MLTATRLCRLLVVTALASSAAVSPIRVYAGPNDSAQQLMSRAREPAQAASAVSSLFTAFARDKRFATRVYDAAQHEDKNAIASLVGSRIGIPAPQIEISELRKDFFLRFKTKTKGGTEIDVCIDTDDSACDGKGWILSLKGT